ncbi:Proteolipid membrane potential modulator domain containing protein [Amanita muscaria]
MSEHSQHEPVSSTPNVLLYFLALFIPPLAVFLKRGISSDFWINILLWILGWIPGVLHAWCVLPPSPFDTYSMYRNQQVHHRQERRCYVTLSSPRSLVLLGYSCINDHHCIHGTFFVTYQLYIVRDEIHM